MSVQHHCHCFFAGDFFNSLPVPVQTLTSEYSMFSIDGCSACDEASRKYFLERMTIHTERLLENYDVRMSSYKTKKSHLDRGFWYANDYRKALLETKQNRRLEALKEDLSFFHGRPPKGMEYVADPSSPTGKKAFAYIPEAGIDATTALHNFTSTLCFIDCNEFMQLAFYFTLEEIFGGKRFNCIFAASSVTPFQINMSYATSSLKSYIEITTVREAGTIGNRPVPHGAWTYFRNLSDYSSIHPTGESGAYFVACHMSGTTQRFRGMGLPKTGITETGLYDLFAQEYNAPTTPFTEYATEQFARNVRPPIQRQNTATRQMFIDNSTTLKMSFGCFVILPNLTSIKNAMKIDIVA